MTDVNYAAVKYSIFEKRWRGRVGRNREIFLGSH